MIAVTDTYVYYNRQNSIRQKAIAMFVRQTSKTLAARLAEPRAFIQIVTGPRQTGKTTAVRQAVQSSGLPYRYATADGIVVPPLAWVETEWMQARLLARPDTPAILVLDEIQKVEGWSEVVKRLWDEDCWMGTNLHVVLSGSSALLLKKGYAESLAGRFEIIRSTHWSLAEMGEAFGYTLDDYLLYGGYPGGARLTRDCDRWNEYMRDSIIEATISRDVLQMEEVRRPALLRSLFLLGTHYSGQQLSYRKILGQLDDKGNVTTLAHYLRLLDEAGLLCGLSKYDASKAKRSGSSPRFLVYDSSLMSAAWSSPLDTLLEDPTNRGHLVESAVGAYLLARSKVQGFDLMWWRDGADEVDFVVRRGSSLTAIEVKSGRIRSTGGLAVFCRRFKGAQPLLVGDSNLSVERFLRGEATLF